MKAKNAHEKAMRINQLLVELSKEPHKSESSIELANLYIDVNEFDKALLYAQNVLEENPFNPLGLLVLARVCFRKEEYEQGLAYTQEAMSHSPENLEIQKYYGIALMLNSNYKEAQKVLRDVASISPEDYQVHSVLWIINQHLNDKHGIVSEAKTMCRLQPSFFNCYHYLTSYRIFGEVRVFIFFIVLSCIATSLIFQSPVIILLPWLISVTWVVDGIYAIKTHQVQKAYRFIITGVCYSCLYLYLMYVLLK